jgi:hypothetical protein
MPPDPERTLEDLASLDPDASGPTDVMIAPRPPPSKPRVAGDAMEIFSKLAQRRQPSSIAPIALDVPPPPPPPSNPRRRWSQDSVNLVTLPVAPRTSRAGFIALCGAAAGALVGAVAVVFFLQSEPAVATDSAHPARLARAVDHPPPRSVEIARPTLTSSKVHRHPR